ncbi:hypothetical protein J2T13_000846 [Paenibacillus sp. DS2015]|uniref:hypothetical protein n=1 Tax=Paenibacillus sp. DS2015 TaxID=3373917 RepID=UPI003D1CABC3
MTQLQSVQAMSDQKLNDWLGEKAMGWMVRHKPIGCECDDVDEWWHDGTRFVRDYEYWHPCADHTDSLEVQAKAIEVDGEGYVDNLIAVLDAGQFYNSDGFDTFGISILLQATPRQRAEAAYLTIKFQP